MLEYRKNGQAFFGLPRVANGQLEIVGPFGNEILFSISDGSIVHRSAQCVRFMLGRGLTIEVVGGAAEIENFISLVQTRNDGCSVKGAA